MASPIVNVEALAAPDFIRFLFSTKIKFDCYFVVGNKSDEEPERIGAVKLMLMAHSEVFRLQLEESDLAEKGDVPVKDIHPDTFKGMLKYVYGHDTTSELCFDDADNMLYVAEKYMIKTLKDRLAARLMKLLNPDNLCSLLNNPACYTHLELDSAITEILRYETDRVISSPQFLSVNALGFLKVLEQDGLAVPEIELWRAAIKWAKHRVNSEDGNLLRQQISSFTQHLRLCTLTGDQFCGEVATTDVLTRDEIITVCQSIGRKRKYEELTDICDEIVPRKKLHGKKGEIALRCNSELSQSSEVYFFTLLTKKHSMQLLPLMCRSKERPSMAPENWTYKVNCTTTLTKEVNPHNPDSSLTEEPPITISYNENVKYGIEFEIPLAVDGKNIILLPDTKYTVTMKLTGVHWRYNICDDTTENDHLKLAISGERTARTTSTTDESQSPIYHPTYETYYYHYFPSSKMQYRVSDVE